MKMEPQDPGRGENPAKDVAPEGFHQEGAFQLLLDDLTGLLHQFAIGHA